MNYYDAEGFLHKIEKNGRSVSFIFRDREIAAESSKEDTIRYIRGYDIVCSDSEEEKKQIQNMDYFRLKLKGRKYVVRFSR